MSNDIDKTVKTLKITFLPAIKTKTTQSGCEKNSLIKTKKGEKNE